MDLNKIKDPSFLKELDIRQLNELAGEIRQFLINSISQTGGHLSSNLGVVELTIALHYVFNSPEDKIFFDVGHQSYVHKILTGRANQFATLRKYGGLSGFQKRCESEHDCFEAGHSSTALSAAIGMAVARDLNHQNFHVIPVIGDAAMVGGESLEALNHLGSINNKVIIILNDNQMAIGKSIGGFGEFLSSVRISGTYNNLKEDYRNLTSHNKFGQMIFNVSKRIKDFVKHGLIDDTIFEDFGVEYLGPVNGHNFDDLIRVLNLAKNSKSSVVVHVVTKKGRGYKFAENDKSGKWHGIAPFNIADGTLKNPEKNGKVSWSKVVADYIEMKMASDQDIVAITPAMIHGSAMDNLFKHYPDRCFDVGIAEEHALTFTCGLSLAKKKPFISVYSSFLQRAYDQINHDLARMDLSCLICVDRCGFVGADGPTHHGVFDLGILNQLPNVIICAPNDSANTKRFINTYLKNNDHPYILRIPRGEIENNEIEEDEILPIGKWQIDITNDYDVTVISYGQNVTRINEYFKDKEIKIRLVNALYIKPMDTQMLQDIVDDKPLVVYETDLKINSLASNIAYYYSQNKILKNIYSFGVDDHYSTQGTIDEILKDEGLDMDSFYQRIKEIINEERTN
ncbi:1-deoxy-D-xylulose-5-phosphate synthase [Erysipelatoclostridium sp. An173]|uniref:1-deoxy-D-xylulose-5-phosphate synthase n=1 Tax=Erysipelatoclostridium sp. An173 TaxID=1965571 RepID=UPI000B38F246|nr:1-deoxy-D-xylulose-5-phosphate synthase [Erysipelatoclostridium sp. An173]OUP79039.1 1-deoxy-D-xylulose-5-phosphate synthase [Erysipelatoclostridium sp. An173]